jgi:hypothetical protein
MLGWIDSEMLRSYLSTRSGNMEGEKRQMFLSGPKAFGTGA